MDKVFGIVSDIASVVTLVLFVFYMIGHIWRIQRIKYTLGEIYDLEDNFDEEKLPVERFVDLSTGGGQLFSIYSPNGFKKVCFYESVMDKKTCILSKGKLIKKFGRTNANEKIYAKLDIPDINNGCFVKIKKADGVIIKFGVATSGKDGSLVKTDYKIKLTLKSWIYYLCS